MTIKTLATFYLTAVNIMLTPYSLFLYTVNKEAKRYADQDKKNKDEKRVKLVQANSTAYKITRIDSDSGRSTEK